jgi:hypothetical protein
VTRRFRITPAMGAALGALAGFGIAKLFPFLGGG